METGGDISDARLNLVFVRKRNQPSAGFGGPALWKILCLRKAKPGLQAKTCPDLPRQESVYLSAGEVLSFRFAPLFVGVPDLEKVSIFQRMVISLQNYRELEYVKL